MVEVPTEGERGPRIPAAAYLPPPGIWDKVRPHPLTYPGQPGVTPSALPQTSSVLLRQRRPAGSTWHLQPLPRGQVGQSCSSKRLRKVPQAAAPGQRVRKGNKVALGKPANAAGVPHSPLQSPGTPCPGWCQRFTGGRRSGSLLGAASVCRSLLQRTEW